MKRNPIHSISLRRFGTQAIVETVTVIIMTAAIIFSICTVSFTAITQLSFAASTVSFMPERFVLIKIRAYIVFALAMNHQALTQKSASYRKVQEENEKFAMRVYLNRIGFIGEEFKSCRKHLYEHLDGNAAWRYGSKENCRSRRKPKERNEVNTDEEV